MHDVDRIYGTAGQILLSEPLRVYSTVATAGLPANTWHELPIAPLTHEERLTAMVDGFAGPIVAGDKPVVSADDGLAVLAIVLAAYRSGAEGRPVTLAARRAEPATTT